MSDNTNFSWVETHKGIVEYLKGMENRQTELIDLLKDAGIKIADDEAIKGKKIPLTEIDPFTFFFYIYKYKGEGRIKLLQKIAAKLNLPSPEGDSGIPSTYPRNVWLFPPIYKRTNNEIQRLWKFFFAALKQNITDDQFSDIKNISGVGLTKLTQGLFYIDPGTYLPIDKQTTPYIKKEFSITPDFETYTEYANILKSIREQTKTSFYEISYDAWAYNNQATLPQPSKYWIFQGNTKVFPEVFERLNENKIERWYVNQNKNNIKNGDKGILWITGKQRGCYALFDIVSNVLKSSEKDYVKINITNNLSFNPITLEIINLHQELKDLRIGNQGTNFPATEKQYLTLKDIAENNRSKKYWLFAPGDNAKFWEEFYSKGIMAIGWSDVGNLSNYETREDITKKLQEVGKTTSNKGNDSLCLSEFKEGISIGDTIIVKKGIHALLGYGVVTSDYYFDDERETYKNCRKVSWELNGEWETEFKLVAKTLTDITKYPTEHPNYKTYYERLMAIMTDPNYKTYPSPVIPSHYPLNTIFYGPPGTGKTYEAIRRAASIVEKKEFPDYNEALKKFQEHLGKRIEFITFHQNYSYEDFIQGLRPDTENDADLIFKKRDGIFKKLADRALENLKLSQKDPAEAAKESLFDIGLKKFIEEVEEQEDNYKINDSAYIKSVDEDAFRYTGAAWANNTHGNRMKFSDMREFYINNVTQRKEIRYLSKVSGQAKQHATYYFLVYEKLKKFIPSKPEAQHPVQCENFVILIDEINRANISRVFGELITLIEKDKRFGGEIPLTSKLPSGDEFCVPANLYIIGTMNTADKSIALLDIALRRRFEFEPLYPKYEIDGEPINEPEILRKMNDIIIKSKGHDFQIGHSFFMGIEFDLVKQMNTKVIPLLLEYFMNDEEEVKKILKDSGLVVEDSWPIKITGKK
ncbi:MAG TPA: AAA family ATPase [Ignavibacteriaceae bacterium]|nr:AAA family ATPase [Ignavibacteriaceae bacterium]